MKQLVNLLIRKAKTVQVQLVTGLLYEGRFTETYDNGALLMCGDLEVYIAIDKIMTISPKC